MDDGVADGSSPSETEPSIISAWPTGREVVQAALSESVHLLLVHLPVARAGDDPEGVHQCRVAARRLRSDLRTFRSLLEPTWVRPLRDDLGTFTRAFGAVRDGDVMAGALRGVDADPLLLDAVDAERSEHRAALVAALDDPATAQLLDALVAAAHDPRTAPQADDPAEELLRPLVRKRWKRLERSIEDLGHHPADDDLHNARLVTKQCRYASMAVAPVFGKPARQFARSLGALQDALGAHNDMRVMSEHLRDIAFRADTTSGDATLAFVAGEAVGRLQAEADEHRDDWRRVWTRVSEEASPMALIVALSSIKGGVGKTSAAVNLAALSASDGRRTLLWDLDPQGAATYALQVGTRVPGGARRIVRKNPGVASAISRTVWPDLDVIPADFSLRHLDIELTQTNNPRQRLRRTISPVLDDYDNVFIDCPPGITLAIESALRATDIVLVPVVPSVLPMRSYEQLVAYVEADAKLRRSKVLAFLSMVDRRKKAHRMLCDEAAARSDDRVLQAAIPASVHVEAMAERRIPLVTAQPSATATRAYRALWDELQERAVRRG